MDSNTKIPTDNPQHSETCAPSALDDECPPLPEEPEGITFITSFPGTGKSRAKAVEMVDRALRGELLTYVAAGHAQLLEMERLILDELDRRGVTNEVSDGQGRPWVRVARKISRLEQVECADGSVSPSCHPDQRRHLRVLTHKVGNVRTGQYCGTKPDKGGCPRSEVCEAKAFSEANESRLENANIRLLSEAAFAGAWKSDERRRLIIDDVTTLVETINISGEMMAALRAAHRRDFPNVELRALLVASEVAHAWHEGREYGDVWFSETVVSAGEWLAANPDLAVIESLNPALASITRPEAARLVRDVIRLAASGWRPESPTAEVKNAWIRSRLLIEAEACGAEWLDATPWTEALDLLGVKYSTRCESTYPAETAHAWRTHKKCGGAGSFKKSGKGPLTCTRFDPVKGRFREVKLPKGTVGADWVRILADIEEVSSGEEEWLFVSFSEIINVLLEKEVDGKRVVTDIVERDGELAPAEVERLEALRRCREILGDRAADRLGYFGNLRSRNGWKDVGAVYVLGTPWMAAGEILQAIGVEDGSDRYWRAMRQYAQNEITQAVERCRSARRAEPDRAVTIIVEADVPGVGAEWEPSEPTGRLVDLRPSLTFRETREGTKRALAGMVEDAVRVHGEGTLAEIAADLRVQVETLRDYLARGRIPAEHARALARWSPSSEERADAYLRGESPLPDQAERVRLLSEWCDREGVKAVAGALGKSKGTVSKMRSGDAKIGDDATRTILATAT